MDRAEAIKHFEYGISHDVFSEPVTGYARMAVDALREQERREWISVKKRLPKRGKRVLCYMKYEPEQGDMICDNTYNGPLVGTRGKIHVWQFDGDFVTHWMPLPEPPKGE